MADPEQLVIEFYPPPSELRQLWTPDDIYNGANDDVVRAFSEDSRVERKPCGIHAKQLGDYVCMYANTQPHGGVIFIGVENNGKLSGCKSLSVQQINKLEVVKNYCADARYEFKKVSVKNEDGEPDFVMMVRVYYRPDKLVETVGGEAWVRLGEQKRRLTEDEKREIRINKGQVEYELEPVNLSWPEDFDLELADKLAASYIQKRGLTKKFKREDILSLLHLGKRTGDQFAPNLACAVVLAKDPRSVVPGARIRISRYDGPEESFGKEMNQVFDAFVDGPLAVQITEAERIINGQIKNFTRLGADGKFYTQPEYPHDVWLEAVINACVHRSYNLKYMNIYVKMFANKLVVESPGAFLPPTTAETVYESHNPRNPYAMEALFYLEFVHCAYEGTRRMRETMRIANLPPPEFVQKEVANHQIHVTLKNNLEHRKTFLDANVAELVGRSLFETLTEHEKLLINFVSEKASISVSDASRLIAKDWHASKSVLEGLVERKILRLRSKTGAVRESSKRYVLNRPNGQK